MCWRCAKWHISKCIGINNNSFKDVELRWGTHMILIHILKMTERAEKVFTVEYSIQLDL